MKRRMFDNPDALTEIALRAFARAKKAAIEENDRRGVPSYGGKDGRIVVRHAAQLPVFDPRKPDEITGMSDDHLHQKSRPTIGGDEIDWSEWSREDGERAASYTPEHEPRGEDELYYLILRLLQQDCGNDPNAFDSWAISAYEGAIIELDRAGLVEIDRGCGRIYAKITAKGRNFEAWMEGHEHKKDIAEARRFLAALPGASEKRRKAVARCYRITLAELDGEQTKP
jgi:hypothetical protein